MNDIWQENDPNGDLENQTDVEESHSTDNNTSELSVENCNNISSNNSSQIISDINDANHVNNKETIIDNAYTTYQTNTDTMIKKNIDKNIAPKNAETNSEQLPNGTRDTATVTQLEESNPVKNELLEQFEKSKRLLNGNLLMKSLTSATSNHTGNFLPRLPENAFVDKKSGNSLVKKSSKKLDDDPIPGFTEFSNLRETLL